MGAPKTPTDAAPSYEELYQNHPVNLQAPSGSSSAYAAVPQGDMDDEAEVESQPQTHQHEHGHDHEQVTPSPSMGFPLGSVNTKPHEHCAACDRQMESREGRRNQKHCCTMVAATFMVLFFCIAVGAVIIFSRDRA